MNAWNAFETHDWFNQNVWNLVKLLKICKLLKQSFADVRRWFWDTINWTIMTSLCFITVDAWMTKITTLPAPFENLVKDSQHVTVLNCGIVLLIIYLITADKIISSPAYKIEKRTSKLVNSTSQAPWKHQNNVWNTTKVNNKNTWVNSFTWNRICALPWYFHCWLWLRKYKAE